MASSIKQPFHFGHFFFSLKGRLTRAPFISFILPLKLVAAAVLLAQYTGLPFTPSTAFGLIIFQLIVVWPQYAVTVKRLHDIGRSTLFALYIPIYMVAWLSYLVFFYYYSRLQPLNLLPYMAYNFLRFIFLLYGFILFIVLAIVPSTRGMNHHGPHPRRADQSVSDVF